MRWYRYVMKVVPHFGFWDWTFWKLLLLVLGVLLAKIWPVLMSLDYWWYVGALIVGEIYFLIRVQRIHQMLSAGESLDRS